MQKLTLTLLLSLVCFGLAGQNIKKLDEKYGFRDLKFETPIDSLEGMGLIKDEGDFKVYDKTDDAMNVGEYELSGLSYTFYKGRLLAVNMKTKGYTNSRGVLGALNELYGPGYQSNQFMEKYYWFGKKATASYEENSATHDASIRISSDKISKQISADDKEKRIKAKDGF